MAFGFVKGTNSFVDFFSTYGAAGLDPIRSGQLVASGRLGREEVAEKNMAICQSFFDNKSIRRMVI